MASSRQRMVFEFPERLKKAIRMRAALDGLKPSGEFSDPEGRQSRIC